MLAAGSELWTLRCTCASVALATTSKSMIMQQEMGLKEAGRRMGASMPKSAGDLDGNLRAVRSVALCRPPEFPGATLRPQGASRTSDAQCL
jgi:hypothetical protein